MTLRLPFLWSFALLAVVLGCVSPEASRTEPSGKPVLRVGVTPNYPPLIDKVGGEMVGLEADLARAVAGPLGREARFVSLKWGDLLPALNEGRIDVIMSGMSVTPGRAAQARFTNPFLASGQMILVRANQASRYAVLRSLPLTSDRIAVEKGTTGDMFVQRRCPVAKRVAFRSIAKAVAALKAGDVDVVLHDAPAILEQAMRHEADGLVPIRGVVTEEWLAWAVRRDDEALATALNAALADLQADGTLDSLNHRWIPLYRTYWSPPSDQAP
ncbi:MAG: transporter substrate-binding domain-containing protein [Lentisphaerae bacterium]|nr:transporter substrate-binding domain-containing protein [Lentisphaerota bacterium]